MSISVIIPTFNSWATLRSCLASINNQTLKPEEIIVVDNASSDGTSENVKKNFPKVKLVSLKRNTGVTGGRNAGIKAASKKSDYFLFFDHDLVADKNMLLNLVSVTEMDKSYGIITPKIYYWGDKNRIWAAGTNINLWSGQVLFRRGEDQGQFEKIEEVQMAPAAMFVKSEVLDKINGFDDRYFSTFEDTDFCFRAREHGYKTIYASYAVAYHKISPQKDKEQERLLDRSFWIGRNRILFMGDYGKNFYLFLILSAIYLLYFFELALEQNNPKGLVNYLRGVISGLVEELVSRRILIHLPFTMYNVLLKTIGETPKTILDVACGDGMSMSILNYKKQWMVTGIDIYKSYVDRAKQRGVYKEVILGDIRKINKIFKNKKFDVILVSSVLDHLEKEEALDLIAKCEKLGEKVILSGLPNGFSEKHEAYFWEGANPYQEHKSHWDLEDFKKRDYIIRGFGNSYMIGEKRLSNKNFWNKSALLTPVKLLLIFLENLLAYFLAPITFYFPKNSVSLMAIKNIQK